MCLLTITKSKFDRRSDAAYTATVHPYGIGVGPNLLHASLRHSADPQIVPESVGMLPCGLYYEWEVCRVNIGTP